MVSSLHYRSGTIEPRFWTACVIFSDGGYEYDSIDYPAILRVFISDCHLDPSLAQHISRQNATLVAELCRGVGDCAEALGEEFRGLLGRTLYPMLQKLGLNLDVACIIVIFLALRMLCSFDSGDPNPICQQAAHSSLVRIAYYCGYHSSSEPAMDIKLLVTSSTITDMLCPAVSVMILQNADYLIDTIAFQMRHLDDLTTLATPRMLLV